MTPGKWLALLAIGSVVAAVDAVRRVLRWTRGDEKTPSRRREAP